ncbi:MAG: BatA domain-containing protein, partial [Sedimentisphaerales bacterium]|nr:BatA domain-containing protein [Sedimentisphaerales bacterium]
MSFLYPLLLAGIAAVAAPILLHLIRRHTRNRVTFSSLMFLHATMPRFQSRSRLEHIPLLILRCLILCLLAFAFARPFLVRPGAVGQVPPGGRIVLLIDTSASMRREGAWARAIEEAKSVIASAGPADRVCVMSFGRTTRTLIGFEQWQAMSPAQRASIAAAELSRLSPGWTSTNLGHALVAAAEAIEDDEANDGRQGIGERQVVLVSDLRQGSDLDALAGYEWPECTQLVVRAIPCREATNASLQWMTGRDAQVLSDRGRPLAVRVTNSPDANRDRFQLRWGDNQQTEVYVPAGQSIVVHAPADLNQGTTTRLLLTGDDLDFDNILYLAPQPPRRITILYIGNDDPNDTREMLYYVRRAFGTSGKMTIRVVRHPSDELIDAADIEAAKMIVVTDVVSPPNAVTLRQYVQSGGILLLVMRSVETAAAVSELAGTDRLECREADPDRYAMLDRVEFEHPLLKPFSDPRFGDFTRIHFWRHRRIEAADCPGARVLAWFDD